MSISLDQLNQIMNDGQVVTSHGDKVGSLGQVYLDDATGTPSWVTVKSGLFGTSETFVPIDAARLEGSDLVVDYDKATIKDAPRIEADGSLTQDEEQALYQHYGLQGTSGFSGGTDFSGDRTDLSGDRTDLSGDRTGFSGDRTDQNATGYDTSGPETDSAMTRSEERLRVGKETVETGRARLRKYVVTENVTQTVPVSREEVRLVREPITEDNMDEALAGPEISEEEHEVVLHAERPVVQKEAVPVERVRVDAETVTEEQTVGGEVRKEQIEFEDSSNKGSDRR
jgi:uncharacterized protein (TIGR02271 family)